MLTLPYSADARPLVVAVYRAAPPQTPDTPPHVELLFQGVDAGRVRIEISANGPIGEVYLASNAILRCSPHAGSLQGLHALPASGAVRVQAVGADGRPAGDTNVFAGTFDTAVTRQDCDVETGAHRDDFSALRLGVLGGYRFFTQTGGEQFIPGDARMHPVERYTLRFDASVEKPIFEGAGVALRGPSECELTEDAAAVVVRWQDRNRAGVREFGLFIFAGAFAIGASMLVELVKPRFLE